MLLKKWRSHPTMLANELQKCMQKAKKKMNSLAIKLTGRDIENFTFSSQYGKTLRGNLITDWDDEDEDDDGEDGEHEDLDHSFE